MLSHFLSGVAAFAWAVRYHRKFRLRHGEHGRYFLKAINLAVCYRGFDPGHSLSAALGAGKAGFFCCAYDIVTDWRRFDPEYFSLFCFLADNHLNANERGLATGLYWAEKKNCVEHDGLDRGIVALEFVTRLMGTYNHIGTHSDPAQLGIVLQIVDDVLDLEEDRAEYDQNSLNSNRRDEYLRLLGTFSMRELSDLFPRGYVLRHVISIAQNKARSILESSENSARDERAQISKQLDRNITVLH